MEKRCRHIVRSVKKGSIAEEMDIEAGDELLSIDNTEIEDIFDYQFLIQDSYIEVLVQKKDGEQWLLEIDKDPDEDLGIEFENGLMDEYRHCHNKCIFCFIDQMPKGMRDTLYFKDDDSRLSFLQGNYVTLTNMSDHDIDRICRYRLSPINISFHTMNPELRCRMLNNRFAGEALRKVDRLNEADILMNGQIVLCKGINDGAELEFSIRELMKYIPNLESVSVVPVGLSGFREGLYPLEPFNAEDAKEVLGIIHRFQDECYARYGTHFVHAGDEWYVMAGAEMPGEERYDGYLQLENGVGMLRLLLDEFQDALSRMPEGEDPLSESGEGTQSRKAIVSLATGVLAYPYIQQMCAEVMERFPNVDIRVYAIRNHFFGENITVSGLLTGQDIREQLRGRELGRRLLLPRNVLRSDEDVFLDDLTVTDLEESLQVPIYIVKSSGYDFLESILAAAEQGDER
ncbi:MAG: DUF512 domain-containing protein [Clostridium sp.]|nr:DUF512 domain-containing protein [Acetatifactor muris]MCM1527968.1 DUF512 domain-containing protein [Bacteroides sp.]MCM1564238.1 DUF512 domain-containing protein [Clostridium sp.]